jgi:hypothetical protein
MTAMLAQRGGGGVAPKHSQASTRRRWGVSTTLQPLYPREREPVPTVQEAGWSSGPVWMAPGFDLRTDQLAAGRYTNYAILAICLNTTSKCI